MRVCGPREPQRHLFPLGWDLFTSNRKRWKAGPSKDSGRVQKGAVVWMIRLPPTKPEHGEGGWGDTSLRPEWVVSCGPPPEGGWVPGHKV